MSSNIESIRIRASGIIITELTKEFDNEQIKYRRGPIYFDLSSKEYLDLFSHLGSVAIGAIAAIIIAKIKKNKKVRIITKDEQGERVIEATTADDLIKVMEAHDKSKKVKEIVIE